MKPVRRPGQLLLDDDDHTLEPTEAPTVVTKLPADAEDPTFAPKTQAPPRSSDADLKAHAAKEDPTLAVKTGSPDARSEDPTLSAHMKAPVVGALPEEPTVSAQVDVRAAFDAQQVSFPRAASVLEPIEEPPPPQERTLPLVSPAQVLAARKATAPDSGALPPPSDPILVPPAPVDEDEPDIPGVSGPPRRRMFRVVFGVLGLCGLLLVGALAKQLLVAAPSPPPPATTPSPTAEAPTSTTATSASATETASPAPSAPAASAPPTPPPPAPPPPAPPRSPALPTHRAEPQARGAAPRAAPPPAAKPTGRGSIVRDTPF